MMKEVPSDVQRHSTCGKVMHNYNTRFIEFRLSGYLVIWKMHVPNNQ